MEENKWGICEWVLPVTGPYALKLASDTGFSGIQIGDLGGSGMGFPVNHPKIQEGYLEASQLYNLELHSLHLHTLVREGTMIHPRESKKGMEAMISINKGIEACRAMKIPLLMLSSFFSSQIKNDYEFRNFAAMLKYACEVAAGNGVTIVFESVLFIDRILRMRETVGEDLKICYDTLNPIRYGTGNPQEEIRKIGRDAIDHVHLKDAPDNLIGCCSLNEGAGQFCATADTLNSINYKGWFITENYYSLPPMLNDGNDPFVLAEKDLKTMQKFFP